MTRAEFARLVKRGVLNLLWHNAETNEVEAVAPRTGMRVRLRPDLPGLPVTAELEKP
jgi:hypothetical protein